MTTITITYTEPGTGRKITYTKSIPDDQIYHLLEVLDEIADNA